MGCGTSLQKKNQIITQSNIIRTKTMADEKQQNDADLIIKERNEVNEKDQVENTVQDEEENSGEKQDFNNNIKLYELTIRTQDAEVKPEFQEAHDECKDKLTEAMNFLKNTEDFKNEQVLNSMEVLKKSYSNAKMPTYRPLFGEHLCNIGFPALFIKFWIELNKLDLFDPENEQEMKVFKAMKALAWNYSDASIKICAELGMAGAVPLLLSSLTQKELLPETLTNPVIIHVKGSLGILNNMVRLYPDNIQLLRDNNAVKLLLDYTAVKFLILKANCFMILSFLITDEEVSLLENTGVAVRFIIDLLTTSLTGGKARGYSTSEILLSLNNLALNDENKVKIVEYNGLAQLDRALKKRTKSNLILSAMLIWKLAFIEQNRKRMREEESLINGLKLNKSSDIPKVQAACSGALWEIFEGQTEVNEDDTPVIQPKFKKGPHVMISYQWDVQPRIIKLKEKLQNAGYSVWMDIDQMEGDILGAMAAAVENAAVILSCISKKYKDSTSCRTEATYAYKQNKPIIPLMVEENYVPDGWLGALIGTLIYFPLFDDSKLEAEFHRIISEIGDRGKEQKGQKKIQHKEILAVSAPIEGSANRGVDSPDKPVAPPPKATPPKIKADISNWTSNDVEKWLKEIKLEECSSAMKDVDGDILMQMYKMSKEAPDFFYSRLERDFNMNHLMQILKFSSALEKLLC